MTGIIPYIHSSSNLDYLWSPYRRSSVHHSTMSVCTSLDATTAGGRWQCVCYSHAMAPSQHLAMVQQPSKPYSFTLGRMIINILKLLPVAWSLSCIPPKKLLHLKPKTPHNSNFSVGNSIKLNVKSGYFPTIILKCINYNNSCLN